MSGLQFLMCNCGLASNSIGEWGNNKGIDNETEDKVGTRYDSVLAASWRCGCGDDNGELP